MPLLRVVVFRMGKRTAMGFSVALVLGAGTFPGTRAIKTGGIEIGQPPEASGPVGRFQAAFSGTDRTPRVIDTTTGKLYQISAPPRNPDGTMVSGYEAGQLIWVGYSKKYKLPSLLTQ